MTIATPSTSRVALLETHAQLRREIESVCGATAPALAAAAAQEEAAAAALRDARIAHSNLAAARRQQLTSLEGQCQEIVGWLEGEYCPAAITVCLGTLSAAVESLRMDSRDSRLPDKIEQFGELLTARDEVRALRRTARDEADARTQVDAILQRLRSGPSRKWLPAA